MYTGQYKGLQGPILCATLLLKTGISSNNLVPELADFVYICILLKKVLTLRLIDQTRYRVREERLERGERENQELV